MDTLNILRDLIAIPSLTSDVTACKSVLNNAGSLLSTNSINSQIVLSAGRPILVWGELDFSQTKWLINSHLDVVPGRDAQFNPTIKQDRLFGRGAADTKSSCSVMLANSSKWIEFSLAKHITFMLVVDEETGGDSTRLVLPKMSTLQGAIFLEPSNRQMVLAAKGIMQLKITASGVACHGSRPWQGDSALEILTTGITRFRRRHKSPLHETRDTTYNFSRLNSGGAINQIPDSGELWCDIRWNPQDNPDKIILDMRRTFRRCQLDVVKLESPINCPKSSLLARSFADSLRSCTINPISGFDHGSSDARHCTALGIPSLVFGPKGGNLHGDGEWVSLQSLDHITKVLDHWITNI